MDCIIRQGIRGTDFADDHLTMVSEMILKRIATWWNNRSSVKVENLIPDALMILLCLIALVQGVQTTGDLDWTGEVDKSRDTGQAQAMLEGDFWSDPQYLGEMLWYNPLTPGLVAVITRLTNLSVYVVYTRAGAYLNLFAPLFFYILIACLADRWTALAATFAFLFVPLTSDTSLPAPSYSPWLYSRNFVQAWFYLTLVVYIKARSRRTRRWYVATGVLLGVTFLGHSAPALLLIIIIGCVTLGDVIQSVRLRSREWFRPFIDAGLIAVMALIIGSPLLYSIIIHYQFHILNSGPGSYTPDSLLLNNLGPFLTESFIGQPTFWIAGIGLIAWLWPRIKRTDRSVLVIWLVASTLLDAYGYLVQAAQQRGISLPSLVPSFHFLFYLWAGEYVLIGCGLVALSRLAIQVLRWALPIVKRHLIAHERLQLKLDRVALLVVLIGLFSYEYPLYPTRADFVAERALAQEFSADTETLNAYHWVRAHSQLTDVFLSSDRLSTFVISPAGRKIIAGSKWFSNPYVDWKARATDRDAMFGQLMNGKATEFCALATKYHTTFVAAGSKLAEGVDAGNSTALSKVFTSGRISIYRVQCK
jgi:hypothetical protein